MGNTPDPLVIVLTGQLPFVVLAATGLALPVSWALLRLYRRAVVRSMAAAAPSGASVAADWAAPASAHRPRSAAAPGSLRRAVLRGPWRSAAVHGGAGLLAAAWMTAAYLVAGTTGFVPLRTLLVFWVHAWPVVLTFLFAGPSSGRGRYLLVLAYGVGYLLLCEAGVARNPGLGWAQLLFVWGEFNLPPSLLLLLFLNRRVRAVGPLVLVFLAAAVAGGVAALGLVGSDERFLQALASVGFSLGLGANGVFAGIALAGMAAAAVPGVLVLLWIRRAHRAGRLTDQTLILDAVWLLFALSHGVDLVFEGLRWGLSGPLAFGVYALSARAGFRLLRPKGGSPAASLLVLRVFSLGRRSERLFDAVARHWRHGGGLRLIAGPDLATATVEPHEFLDFVSGRLSRRFIGSAEVLEECLAEADAPRDGDGRFRVHEFFCFDNTWQAVLGRLVGGADAVFMDLRGFSEQNAGCCHELRELIHRVPLGRAVVVVDGSTHQSFLEASLEDFFSGLPSDSPNRGATSTALALFRYRGRGDLPGLLERLTLAAEAA